MQLISCFVLRLEIINGTRNQWRQRHCDIYLLNFRCSREAKLLRSSCSGNTVRGLSVKFPNFFNKTLFYLHRSYSALSPSKYFKSSVILRTAFVHVCSGVPMFESLTRHGQSRQISCSAPVHRGNTKILPWLGHDGPLPDSYQVIIHHSWPSMLLYSLKYCRRREISHRIDLVMSWCPMQGSYVLFILSTVSCYINSSLEQVREW